EEIANFVADASPDAYEKQVERLLASPHYGERMAQSWLDVARYADTVGYHGDQNQHAWPYRDYVVRAFNDNKPFDEFTREQLAGDLLPDPTEEQLTATCFNRLNMMTREGGAQTQEYLTLYTADRVRTVSMAFLGSTFGCAQCHDHKFDPITQRDFYSLGAFFADVKQYGVYTDYKSSPEPELKGYNNDYPFPPEIEVTSPTLVSRRDRYRSELRELEGSVDTRSDAFIRWREAVVAFCEEHPTAWETPLPVVRNKEEDQPAPTADDAPQADEGAPFFRVENNHAVLFPSSAPQHMELEVDPQGKAIASVRVQLLPHHQHGGKSLTRVEPTKIAVQFGVVGRSQERPIDVRHATANRWEPRYASGDEILGVHEGWQLDLSAIERPHTAIYVLEEPLTLVPGERLVAAIHTLAPGHPWETPPTEELRRLACVRLSTSPLGLTDLSDDRLAPHVASRLSDDTAAARWFVRAAAAGPGVYRRVVELDRAILNTRDGRASVMVTERTADPLAVRLLPRGDWQDDSGEVCPPTTPSFLPGPTGAEETGLSRLDLAEWICGDANPLTARVIANRLWQQFFGAGLSVQVDDLGAQGEAPSHPELLDWLASEFRDCGWDTKQLVRLIVTSHTYRQSSRLRPEARERDPQNRLLSSQNPRRLDAESVRDNALAIAGAIHLEVGGPPVRPYQPEGYYAGLQFPNRVYLAAAGQQQHRRGIYSHWQRTFLHPMLANFDAPSREDCVAMRTESNSPQQALTLLNDPSMVEAARLWAERLIAERTSDAERIDRAFLEAVARPPTDAERSSLLGFLQEARRNYANTPDDSARLLAIGVTPPTAVAGPEEVAAWTNVARVILNLHETITRY
ncbi:MAG: DUF1549 and DUF1553 domain-containing protein, partial [Planctomycetota bacterium]